MRDSSMISLIMDIWLSANEASVYLTCLQYWPVSVTTIARITAMPRSTIYGIIDQLSKDWYIVKHEWHQWATYSWISYQQLTWLLNQKAEKIKQQQQKISEHQSQFELLQSWFSHNALTTYYSPSEIQSIMYKKITTSEFVRSIRDIDGAIDFYESNYQQISTIAQQSQWITQRILYDSDNARKFKKEYQTENYQISLRPEPVCKHADIMIFDGSVFHGSYKDHHTWIEIHDNVFFAMQSSLFDSLRNSLSSHNDTI